MANSREAEGQPVTVHVPMRFRKRGGRKLIIAPSGAGSSEPPPSRPNSALIKAIARGFRWRKLLETGVHATIEDMAAAEKINPSYVSRLLRLSLLAPDIVEAILDGRAQVSLQLGDLHAPLPLDWERQTEALGPI